MTQFQTSTHDMALRAMKHEDVQIALVAYLADKNNFTAHKLNSALAAAGIQDLKARERVIVFLATSPKFGGGEDDG